MSITLSKAQHEAVARIRSWFLAPEGKQVFRIFGYAGPGKSTIVKNAQTD